jgi:hypothetical protein
MVMNTKNTLLTAAVVILIMGLFSLGTPRPVLGQDATPATTPAYTLSVRRTFGYSAGGEIRGSFRLVVTGPQENIQKVVFLIDEQSMGTVSEPPFRMDIHTQDYPEGTHTLSAEVTTMDGSLQVAPGGTFDFVSASQQWAGVIKIVVAVGVILVAIVSIGFLFTYLTTGKTIKDIPLGAERHYGIQGGGICSRCGRPFAFHWWGMNLVGAKYDRCDYCGKWGRTKRLPMEELRKAEEAELRNSTQGLSTNLPNPEDKFKSMLDDSRYDSD